MGRHKDESRKNNETKMRKLLDKLINIFYINNRVYTNRKDIYMSDKTTYIIKDINKTTWKSFRAKALLGGYKSAAELLRNLIDDYVKNTKVDGKH